MALGKHPDKYKAGVAGVPVADYELDYDKYPAQVIALDKILLGGKKPSQLPELMADRNPVNFVTQVKAPILFIAGRYDMQCLLSQVMSYVNKLDKKTQEYELYVFEAGHGTEDIKENIKQADIINKFLIKHIPGIKINK